MIFDHLIQLGATVIVIEHDLELVTNCDYIIDMGPWGGTEGGRVVVEGTPEAVAATSESITGRYLKQELAEDKKCSGKFRKKSFAVKHIFRKYQKI